ESNDLSEDDLGMTLMSLMGEPEEISDEEPEDEPEEDKYKVESGRPKGIASSGQTRIAGRRRIPSGAATRATGNSYDGVNVSKVGSDSLSTSESSEHQKGETNGNSGAKGKESSDGLESEEDE
ncbi:hypothetical protein Tco_0112792, partial [Tanacetum coccineum]